MNQLTLSEIWVYPVKSLGGISLSTAKVLPKGLELDRRWMLADETNKFMTQRLCPTMALFKTAIDAQQLTITFNGDQITIPLNTHSGKADVFTVWDDTVTACEVSSHHNEWFSEKLGMKCKLVFFPEENPRAVDPGYAINNDNTSLTDAYPFLIIGQSSLDDLNARLAEPVPINRFRPNFVFTGGKPYEEDDWKEFSIGKNRFAGVKPCSRCVMTTVNQDTAKKGVEPLKTLATYRRRGNDTYFGNNLIAIEATEVRVGDPITF